MIIISTLYPDLENNFPTDIDDFEKFIDPDINSLQAINQYNQYFQAGNLEAANGVLEDNPTLQRMIINAQNMNMLRDGLISVERYYLDDVQQYLVEIVKWRNYWSNNTRYNKYDVVAYQTTDAVEVYMGIVNNIPLGTLPTNLNYWIPLVIRGEKGDAGVGLAFQGAYSSTRQYYKNDCVQYLGSLYGALQDNIDIKPTVGGSDDVWALAWDFQIPDGYITMQMLANDVQVAINNAAIMVDETTGVQYRWGVDNGLVFIEQISQ